MAAERVERVAGGVAQEAQLDRLRFTGPGFEHRGLEVLADHAGIGALDAEHGAGRVVQAGLALGVAEGLQAAEGIEEVQEAGGRAVHGQVGHPVPPGSQRQAGLLAQQVRLGAKVGRVAQAAAEVVPDQPAFQAPDAVAFLAVHDAPLVVLSEAAGTFGNDFGRRIAPASNVAGGLVVGEEVAGHLGIADRYQQVGSVVAEGFVGFGEVEALHHGGEARGRHVVRGRIGGDDGRDERDEGKQRREQGRAEAHA